MACQSLTVEKKLTLLVVFAAGSADTAREAVEQLGAAADALYIKAAARAEGVANTAGCAAGQTGDLRRGEAREQSYGGESKGVHVCLLCFSINERACVST